jgi:hypothetical protein
MAMTWLGQVKNGVVVLDPPGSLPEGAQVRVELINLPAETSQTSQSHDPALAERFHRLAEQWRQDVGPISSTTKLVQHPAYQSIIALGPGVVPLLLEELKRQPDYWFAALKALTGANPVPAEDRGQLNRMAAAWLRWGREHGHIQ